MQEKASILPFAAAIILSASALCPAAACADRGDFSAPLPRVPAADGSPSFEPFYIKPPPPARASPRLRLAHARVVRSIPEDGSAVAPESVGKVEVWYNDPIGKEFVALAVINAAGERVDKRDAAIDSADWTHVSVSVERLPPGEYTVRYRAVSSDTHLVSGAWVFVVRGQ
ncbi:MAG: copper resistance protein CopC [Beijerinckiaceae bacterium]|nr:copper resistance protein CopC [Beijerinckiaceae bacterium]